MILNLSPQVREDTLELSVASDVVTINGEAFDFGPLNEGDILPGEAVSSEFVVGDVTRTGGAIVMTIILPTSQASTAAANFPTPITQSNGTVELPV